MDDGRVYQNEESSFNGGLIGLIGINLLCGLISVLTLFIGVPWAIVLKYRWYVSHVKYGGRILKFDGTGSKLIGSYLLWMILTIVTLGVYLFFMPIKIRQWKVKHTHFEYGESVGESKFTGRVFGLLGTNLLCIFLTLITLALALPSSVAIKQAWETNNTVIDGYRLKFIGRGIGLVGSYLKWIFLTIITFSIYILWIPLKFENWKVSNTRLINPLTEKYIEKYSNEWYENLAIDTNQRARFIIGNRIFAIVTLVIALLSTGFYIYILVILMENLISTQNINYDSLAYSGAILKLLLIIGLGISAVFIGIQGLQNMNTHAKSFGIALKSLTTLFTIQLFIYLISTSLIDAYDIFGHGLDALILILMYIGILCILSLFSTLATRFAKEFKHTISGQDGSAEAYEKSKFYAISFAVSSLAIFIAAFFVTDIRWTIVLTTDIRVLSWVLCAVTFFYIFYYLRNGIPSSFTLTNANSKIRMISDNKSTNNLETPTKQDRINYLLKRSYDNLFSTERDVEKTRIGLQSLYEAIDLGSATAYAQLGNYYRDIKQFNSAYEYYIKGYGAGSAHCAYFLARMYEEGDGREKDEIKAHEWHVKAADMGNSVSQFYAGNNFEEGLVVKKDLIKALHYYSLASENGDFDAALFLGMSYIQGGELVNIDASMAEKHLLNAVKNATNDEEKGDAYNELSIVYLGCLGEVPTSREYLNRTIWFMYAATKLGNTNAIENSKKANSVIIIDERAKSEVANMSEPRNAILPPDFYRETGKKVLRASAQTTSVTTSIVSDTTANNADKQNDSIVRSNNPKNAHEYRNSGFRTGISDAEVIEFNGIVNGFLVSLFIKLILFGIGLGIILYFNANSEAYGAFTVLFYLLAIIIAGLPGLFKSYNNSINISKKVGRFFGEPQYKGTIDSHGNIRIKENSDWMFILFNTLLNLAYYAALAPLEFLVGIIKVIVYKHRIKTYWRNKGE